MKHTEQTKPQTKQQTKPQFEIERLEERIAPSAMTGPSGTEHGYPGPGAGGTIGAAQYHTAGSDSPFIAF